MPQVSSSIPYILHSIAQGEHVQQDFKLRIDDSRKIAKTLSAFANTKGGKLLVGVKDNGTVNGVKQEEEFHMLNAAAEMYCSPPIHLEFQAWKVENKLILEVSVQESTNKPVVAEFEPGVKKAFIRDHDQNILAPAVMLDVWRMSNQHVPTVFHYSAKEQKLVEALRIKERTLSDLCRHAKIPRPVTQKMLAKLIRWQVVNYHVQNGIARFFLR